MQAVIGAQDGTTHQFELNDQQANAMIGLSIGDEVDGGSLGLPGYTLEVTGGSDTEGFPMRTTIKGTGRKKILVSAETGAKDLRSGERKRISVRGNTVSSAIEQLNLKVAEAGSESITDLLADDDDSEETDGDEE